MSRDETPPSECSAEQASAADSDPPSQADAVELNSPVVLQPVAADLQGPREQSASQPTDDNSSVAPATPTLLKSCRPRPGFFGAIGIVVGFLLLQALVAIPFALLFVAYRSMPEVSTILLLESVITFGVTLAIARFALGKGLRRGIALRGLSGTHALNVVLLVVPLMVFEARSKLLGDFEPAVHWQQRAIELSSPDQQDLEARLEMYRAGTPYRERP